MKTSLRLAVAVALLATAMIGAVSAGTHYVSLDSPNPTPPYTNWATAATNIQQAVDAAAALYNCTLTGKLDADAVIIWTIPHYATESGRSDMRPTLWTRHADSAQPTPPARSVNPTLFLRRQ